MLKWAKPNQIRRASECSLDLSSAETCSNLSSDSSSDCSSDLSAPSRHYDHKRANRPKSLHILAHEFPAGDKLELPVRKTPTSRTASSPLYSSCSKANRRSMIVCPSDRLDSPKSYTTDHINNNSVTKFPMFNNQPADTANDGILRITTTDKPQKSGRNSFWKNLRQKAQGKKDNKKIAKAQSMTSLPNTSEQALSATPEIYSDKPYNQQGLSVTPSAEHCSDMSPCHKTRNNVQRRRSFKLIKKQTENKKPKPFAKSTENLLEDCVSVSGSPDSGVSSMRLSSDSDNQVSPASPVTPIDVESTANDLTCLRQQFTDAVLQYLNERLEGKGYSTISMPHSTASSCSSASSARSSKSEEGASDVFCYDTDTVLRRPTHQQHQQQQQHRSCVNSTVLKASF